MKKISGLLFSLLLTANSFGQSFNPYHQSLVDQVNQNNISQNLTDFVNFGVKNFGSDEEENALNWLISKYQSWGYTQIETQEVNAYGETGYNLIVTKTGTLYPDTYIIIDGHYDTIEGPGADDNGSGVSVILELARVLANVQTEYSIKFIHFTAEEWGLIGSQQFVDGIVIPQNLDVKLVFNIDQVGGVAGANNNKVVCEQDESQPYYNNSDSAQATQQLANCIALYSDLNTVYDYAYGSDYVPFQENGYVITGLYEYNESQYPHTPNDTIENMDPSYVFQIAKGSLGALAFFANAYQNMGTGDLNNEQFRIYPNPADLYFVVPAQKSEMKINLFDASGRLVLESVSKPNQDLKINTGLLSNGVYILKTENKITKIIVKHK